MEEPAESTWPARLTGICVLLSVLAPILCAQEPPAYRVEPFWPKQPLPNKWLMQGIPTMVTDKDDHIWVLYRPREIMPDESGASTNPLRTDCCIAASRMALTTRSGFTKKRLGNSPVPSGIMGAWQANSIGLMPSPWIRAAISTPARSIRGSGSEICFDEWRRHRASAPA
jgi:hypothetical protein